MRRITSVLYLWERNSGKRENNLSPICLKKSGQEYLSTAFIVLFLANLNQ